MYNLNKDGTAELPNRILHSLGQSFIDFITIVYFKCFWRNVSILLFKLFGLNVPLSSN